MYTAFSGPDNGHNGKYIENGKLFEAALMEG